VKVVRELHRVDLHALEALLAAADTMTEGACIDGRWTGTTSVDLRVGDVLSPAQRRVLAADPHLRVKLIRLAAREAAQRAPGPIGPANTELSLRFERGLLRIVVDVDAAVGHAPHRLADAPTPR
jgi:hypothetical protein